jgi:hypothetical protein
MKMGDNSTHFVFSFIPVAHDAQAKRNVNNINDVDVAPLSVSLGRLEQLQKVNGIERETNRVHENHQRFPERFEKRERMNCGAMMLDVKFPIINDARIALEMETCEFRCWIDARPAANIIALL